MSSRCQLRIVLDEPSGTYAPGALITGHVEVRVLKRTLCLRLAIRNTWLAYGPGAKDEGVHEELFLFRGKWAPGEVLLYPFRLEAPNAPFTYKGNVLDVNWFLRAQADLLVPDLWGLSFPTWERMLTHPLHRMEHSQVEEDFILVPGSKEEPASDVTPPKGSWRPLELKHELAQDERIGSLDGLWLGSEQVSLGQRVPLRVRLRPQTPLEVRSLTVALVGRELVGNQTHVQHRQDVVMSSNRVLHAGEALEVSSDDLTLPSNAPISFKASFCEFRWYLRLELSLESPARVLQQLVPLQVRYSPSRKEPEPRPDALLPPHVPPGRRPREPRVPNTLPLVSADVRRQLEGGIEELEKAHARYTLLAKLLKRQPWQSGVQARIEVLREGIRQEPTVLEMLTRLDHRARAEAWPDTEPALVLARQVRALRSRLGALIRERLGLLKTQEDHLAESLARLDQFLGQTLAPPLSPEETVLYQGEFLPGLVLAILVGLVGLSLVLAVFGFLPTLLIAGLMFLALLQVLEMLSPLGELLQRGCSGRIWLTQERLICQPSRRRAIHIPLQAIRPGGIRLLSSRHVRVELVDGRHFLLAFIRDAERLAGLLQLRRQF
jgi:hypothetical protein